MYSCMFSTPWRCNPVYLVLPGDVLYRDRRGSVSTHQTERTERFELEESVEFLQTVDNTNIMDELDYQVIILTIVYIHGYLGNWHK